MKVGVKWELRWDESRGEIRVKFREVNYLIVRSKLHPWACMWMHRFQGRLYFWMWRLCILNLDCTVGRIPCKHRCNLLALRFRDHHCELRHNSCHRYKFRNIFHWRRTCSMICKRFYHNIRYHMWEVCRCLLLWFFLVLHREFCFHHQLKKWLFLAENCSLCTFQTQFIHRKTFVWWIDFFGKSTSWRNRIFGKSSFSAKRLFRKINIIDQYSSILKIWFLRT